MTTKNPAKKKHWSQEARDKATALDALLAEYNVKTVDELNEKLAQIQVVNTAETVASRPPVQAEINPSRQWDPLEAITPETRYIEFVSSTSTFVLRPERKHMMPPMTRVVLTKEKTDQWIGCPYYIGDRDDHVRDQNLKAMNQNWHHLRLTNELAERIWSDERYPRPKTAVKDPALFLNWNKRSRMAEGEHEEITEFVPLREATRYLLQKGWKTYIHWVLCDKNFRENFDRRTPNPYKNRIPEIKPEFVE